MTAAASEPLSGGFRYDPASGSAAMLERIIDRALLALVRALDTGYLTRSHVPKRKTIKRREIDDAELTLLLQVLKELSVTDETGRGQDWQLRHQLTLLAVQRGLLTEHDDGDRFRLARTNGNWTLWDVMSASRRDQLLGKAPIPRTRVPGVADLIAAAPADELMAGLRRLDPPRLAGYQDEGAPVAGAPRTAKEG
jgi:hypothetical protein